MLTHRTHQTYSDNLSYVSSAKPTGHALQFYANLYGIPTDGTQPDPDIYITLEALGGPANLGLYCNPGWGQYADVNANYPQPGFAVWQSGSASPIWHLCVVSTAWQVQVSHLSHGVHDLDLAVVGALLIL